MEPFTSAMLMAMKDMIFMPEMHQNFMRGTPSTFTREMAMASVRETMNSLPEQQTLCTNVN